MTLTRLFEWRTIDTVPHDGTEVLLAWHTGYDLPWDGMSGGGDVLEGRCEDGEFYIEGNMPLDEEWLPTHWAPKPSPPKPSAGEEGKRGSQNQ